LGKYDPSYEAKPKAQAEVSNIVTVGRNEKKSVDERMTEYLLAIHCSKK
jgi:hypothetical protein